MILLLHCLRAAAPDAPILPSVIIIRTNSELSLQLRFVVRPLGRS